MGGFGAFIVSLFGIEEFFDVGKCSNADAFFPSFFSHIVEGM